MTAALIAVLAFVASWQLSRALASGRWLVVLDHPNERSLHDAPTPRTGGLAICAGIAAGHAVLAVTLPVAAHALASGCAAALVLGVSLADDFRHVPVPARLAVHLAAGAILIHAGPGLSAFAFPALDWNSPPAVAWALTLLSVVWLINLYNFMDGIDGFAGGMGAIGFATLALLAWRAANPELALSALAIAAACAGFLVCNFPPARIFMGDAGSSVLGLLAAALALTAERAGSFPLWLALLVFSPFVADATVTVLRRALRGEAVWRAHRSHFYQRLVQLGWGHRRTTLAEYALMLACAASAVALQDAAPAAQAAGLCAWIVTYVILMLYVTRLERAGNADDPR